jgi:hypothetical protein
MLCPEEFSQVDHFQTKGDTPILLDLIANVTTGPKPRYFGWRFVWFNVMICSDISWMSICSGQLAQMLDLVSTASAARHHALKGLKNLCSALAWLMSAEISILYLNMLHIWIHDTIRFIRDTLTECAVGRYYASTWVCFFCSMRALGCCHASVFRQNASQGLSLGACRGNALMLLPVCKFSMLKEFERVWKTYLPTIGILRFGI